MNEIIMIIIGVPILWYLLWSMGWVRSSRTLKTLIIWKYRIENGPRQIAYLNTRLRELENHNRMQNALLDQLLYPEDYQKEE